MPAERCPTCGQPLPDRATIRTADALVAAMSVPPPPAPPELKFYRGSSRDVYEGYEHGKTRYYLTYSPGVQATKAALNEATRRGLIVPTWPDAVGSWSLPAQAEDNRQLWEARLARDAARVTAHTKTPHG